MTEKYTMKATLVDKASSDWVKELFERSQTEAKMIPNLFRAMANAPEILQTYLDAYNNFAKHSGFSAAEQQIIFLVISYENGCDYCVAAHSTAAEFQAKVPQDIVEAIRNDNPAVPDKRMQTLIEFTREMLWSRGNPSPKSVEDFIHAGYQEKQILDLVLAIAAKTLSNYTNHLFQTPIDPVFKAREFKVIKFASRVLNYFKR
ncbi:TPA: carboxymuconolactone decarboxylase family protein [Legionella feeleii]